MSRPKCIFGFLNGMLMNNLFIVTAVTEDGDTIASVAVRSEEEGRQALGMDGKTQNRHELYKATCPQGAELEWVPFAKTMSHRGLQAAITRHRGRFAQ